MAARSPTPSARGGTASPAAALQTPNTSAARATPPRRLQVVARAGGGRGMGRGPGAGRGGVRQQPPPREGAPKTAKPLPDYGYFAEADTKAPVYAPLAGRESGDFSKRGGRWSNDFIWNTNWSEQLDYQEQLKKEQEAEAKKKKTSAGGLNLSRVADLEDMSIDLAPKLNAKPPPAAFIPVQTNKTYVKDVFRTPSQGDARRWARSSRFAKQAAKTSLTDGDMARAAAQKEADDIRFEELKKQLQLSNLGLTGVLFAATYAFYPVDIAYSYLFGAIGGAQYLRMLNSGVESYGSTGAAGVVGQQRTLIPVILALGLNRFNELASENTGVTLQLLPILVGFFTYKLSVITRSSIDLFRDLNTNYGADEVAEGDETDKAELDKLAARLEEEYKDKILRG